ncbi:uncharacterized protein LOC132627841 isoform X2 [Lycium barbarum]|uniref:uncharacterized protein LOC132627841 isoform X2 n=1 Tax=Lycium barbarum TaxID=112863 RepID=UPI00293F3754|nr:uncharacterized protein LOC132627841 isoform X2 [Lycium barbarum]
MTGFSKSNFLKRRKQENTLTDRMSGKNSERNLRRRIAYRAMPAEQKEALLERRRAAYSTRRRRLSENSSTSHSMQIDSSPEPPNLIPLPTTTFIRDGLSTPPAKEQPTQCASVYEIGSTSGTCNDRSSLRQSLPTVRGHRSTLMGCWNIKELPCSPSILKKVPNCKFCKARRFQYEPPSFCCSKGSVKLVSHQLPSKLKSLYLGVTDESNHFRTYV